MTRSIRITLLLFLVHSCGLAPAQALQDKPATETASRETLITGSVIEQDLKGGEVHRHWVNLQAEDYLSLRLVEKGINVVLRVYRPDGTKLTEEDTLNGNNDVSRFRMIAQASGPYRIEIDGRSTAPGRYELTVEDLHAAASRDRDMVRASDLWREAELLRRQVTADTLRKAITIYEEVLRYRRALGQKLGEALTLSNIGWCRFFLDERLQAIEASKQAVEIYREIKHREGEGAGLSNVGSIYQEMGEPLKALKYLREALPILQSLPNRYQEAETVQATGWAYHTLGEFRKASDFYRQALPLWQAAGNGEGQAQTLNQLGLISYELGELDRSLDYYQQALKLRQTLKDRRGEAETLGNLAAIYLDLKEMPRARELFEQSLAVAQKMQDRISEAKALSGLGSISSLSGQPEKGLELCHQALQQCRAVGDPRNEAAILRRQGDIFSSLKQTANALRAYQDAAALEKSALNSRGQAQTLLAMAGLQRNSGQLAEARAEIEEALELVESLRSRAGGPNLRTSFLASNQEFYEFYIDLLFQQDGRDPGGNHVATAFEVSERARARTLLESLAESRKEIRQGVEPSLLERERRLQQELNAKDQLWRSLQGKSEEKAAAAKRELEEILAELSQLQGEIQSRSPRYASLTQPQPTSIKTLQKDLLDDNSILLEYWLGKERSFLWAVTKNSLTSYVLPPREAIDTATRDLYSLFTQRESARQPGPARRRLPQADSIEGQRIRLAQRLSQMLLGPVAGLLGNKRLVIVGDGALQYLPFAALPMPLMQRGPNAVPTGKTSGADERASVALKPLILDHEIVSLPSSSALAVLRSESKNRPAPDKMVAVLADPVFSLEDPRFLGRQSANLGGADHPGATPSSPLTPDEPIERSARESGLNTFRRLRFSRLEADAISLLGRDGLSFKAVDFEANRAAALNPDLSRYRVLHFATHGLLNSAHPELSGLVLSLVNEKGESQDGFLRLYEIFNLRLNAELVVLSACRTALGKEIRGEGLVGLTRGFMYAGAPRVVASLWNVEDRATAEFMKRFYKGMLLEGMKPAAALRMAQLSLSKEKQWQSPYYWAAFVLQGEWR